MQNIISAFSALPFTLRHSTPGHCLPMSGGGRRLKAVRSLWDQSKEAFLAQSRLPVSLACTPASPHPRPVCENKKTGPHAAILGGLASSTQNISPGQDVFFKYTPYSTHCQIGHCLWSWPRGGEVEEDNYLCPLFRSQSRSPGNARYSPTPIPEPVLLFSRARLQDLGGSPRTGFLSIMQFLR